MSASEVANELDLGDGQQALAVERPADLEALRQAVAARADQGHALYPQGGRTALDYGGTPEKPGVAVDVRGLNRVIDYPFADMTITVEAGITLAELQRTLAEHNQRLPLEAPAADRATLGGIYATNTSGPRRFGAGRPRDLIIGVGFVSAEGELIKGGGRVVKNVAGYDFPRLLTGSMGTLGILAQMTLKVRPLPEASALVWTWLESIEAVDKTLAMLNTSATRPVAVEVFNRSGAERLGNGFGALDPGWLLVIGYEDNAASVAWQLDRIKDELKGDVQVARDDEAKPLWQALTEFQAGDVGPVTIAANLRLSSVAPFLGKLDPAVWAAGSHAGSGIVRAHWLGPNERDAVAAEVDGLRLFAVNDGGNLTLPRCPADWKLRLHVWGQHRTDWAIAVRIKQALDPRGLLNPGRFVGSI